MQEKNNRKSIIAKSELSQFQKLSLAVAEHDIRTQSLKRLEEQSQEDINLLKVTLSVAARRCSFTLRVFRR